MRLQTSGSSIVIEDRLTPEQLKLDSLTQRARGATDSTPPIGNGDVDGDEQHLLSL